MSHFGAYESTKYVQSQKIILYITFLLVLFNLIIYSLYPTVTCVSTCHYLCLSVMHLSLLICLRFLFLFDFLFHLVCTNLMEIHSWVYNNKALMYNSTATSILWDIHACIFCHSFPLNQGDSLHTICIIPIKFSWLFFQNVHIYLQILPLKLWGPI